MSALIAHERSRPIALRRRSLSAVALVATAAVAFSTFWAEPASMAFAATSASTTTATPLVVDGMNLDAGGTAIVNELERTQVAPGLVHVKYERLDAQGWQQVNILKAELSAETVRVGYLTPPTVAGTGGTVTEMTDSVGALAGINLDRFDINNSTAAAGWGVRDGEILKSGNSDAAPSIVIDENGMGSLVDLLLQGTAGFGDQSLPITGVNVFSMPTDGLTLFNTQWGSYSRTRVLAAGAGIEVQVSALDGSVVSVSDTVGDGQLPNDVIALVANAGTAAATQMATLEAGDTVLIDYAIDAGALEVCEAAGAWHRILTDGVVEQINNSELHPRTMVGFSADGATAYFAVLGGRSATARGMTLTEQGQFMKELGAANATNADGGGSSQMNVREAGDDFSTIQNTPSDGFPRRDGNGLGFFLSQPSSGTLTGFNVTAQTTGDHALRVFPGLHRTLTADGHDEANAPVDTTGTNWATDADTLATVSADGILTGVTSGQTVVTATSGAATGEASVDVLGPISRITTDTQVLTLEAQGSTTDVELVGHDAQGFTAPLEAADVTVSNSNPAAFSVEAQTDGSFLVSATATDGTATLVFTAGGQSVEVAASVPLEVRVIDDFSDISGWTTAQDRAPVGSIEAGEGHEGSGSIRLNYDFTDSTGTRGRYAVAPGAVSGGTGGIDIPGRPQKLSVWLKGDGNGSWLRLQVMQANGVRNWIDGPEGSEARHITWTGWKRVEFSVPETFSFPLKLERIRALETVAAKQYTGALEFSKIYAYLPPEGIVAPEVERPTDAIVTETGGTDDEDLRVAVMSDAQFVARDPESYQVTGARKALQEIVAEKPDVLLINGDLVDEGSAADFELAREILDEELAGVEFPWYYVPGNHEIMGASIENFRAAFGATSNVFDVQGTRFITTSSATGLLRSDFAQVKETRDQLDAAAADPSVTGVLFVSHMPTNDPLATKSSQLSDRNEAAMIDTWLQDFRAESGKSAAYIAGHVGAFHASSIDGVPYVINGNSGKGPASSPDNGGFTGWTMLGIDPAQGAWAGATEPWLEVETKPRIDVGTLALTAPETLIVGDTAEISAEFGQDAGHDDRTVPAAWPVSTKWAGAGVFVGTAADAPTGTIVAADPETGTVTAVADGTAELRVTVRAETVSQQITVALRDFDLADAQVEVTGTPKVGATLTAAQQGWTTPDGAELSLQWLRGDDEISGATGPTYTPTATDAAQTLGVRATVTQFGYSPAVFVSNTVTVGTGDLELQTAPVLSGVGAFGATLTVTPAVWNMATNARYQWLRDGEVIADADTNTYLVTAADAARALSVRVTSTAAGYGSATATTPALTIDQQPVVAQPQSPLIDAELVDDNAGGVTVAVVDGRATLDLTGSSAREDDWLSAQGFSVATPLGWRQVTGGAITVDVSAFAPGSHKIAVFDLQNKLVGWAPFEVATPTTPSTPGSVGNATSADATPDELSSTGFEAGGALAALVLLVLGGGLLLVNHRRRSTAL
ncbi:metallophosphoesterase [Cryobacterium melibiosiphilum]|uniref:Metallophosphoesterase n=1 Tax=Cryobacterium melibiosiphilum TaxID=995039 RepID=A0A3A5MWR2_9MICO|nr:phosphodiester glycosidase family protein [Cryobacterium melibiosiphilum]RJT90446.1 metallophosphoesterase [Cryobacterium melibiosiphilum]